VQITRTPTYPPHPKMVTKMGTRVTALEAEAMTFVAENVPGIPVPQVYDFIEQANGNLILMDEIEGVPLDQSWRTMEDDAKSSICEQLADFIKMWRAIPKPIGFHDEFVGSALGGPCTEPMLSNANVGPFLTCKDFNCGIAEAYEKADGRAYVNILPSMLPEYTKSVFSHGDLAPRNIMIKQGEITGILDWEQAGWYPDYWEYTSIMRPACECGDWQTWITRVIDQYPKTIAVYALIRRVLY